MNALDFLMAGRANDAIKAYQEILARNSNDPGAVDGLASAYMLAGRYADSIPLMWRVHERQKAQTKDHPGQLLKISCAYWCLENRPRAIELARGLCSGISDRTIGMSPDMAGGATFGLVLHYMAVTAGDVGSTNYALEYFSMLAEKYDNRPSLFRYPRETVKHLLGLASFEDVLEAVSKKRTLDAAYEAAQENRSIKSGLGVALFHDGVLHRVRREEAACMVRMTRVFDLGYQTESIRWHLARYEVSGR
jgi:tetratricopeptide (TPR) repeat protein